MIGRLVGYLLTFGPLALVLVAWWRLCRTPERHRPLTWIALIVVGANAALAVGLMLYESFKPSPLPPWQDTVNLTAALLFFLAPVGMIIAYIAWSKGAPKWLTGMLLGASVPLFLIGVFAGIAV